MAVTTSLFSLFRDRGWGQQSEVQVEVPYIAASSQVTAAITPSAPYEAMVVHLITFHNLLPNSFTAIVQQSEVAQHSVTLSGDFDSIGFWAWVTAQYPLYVTLVNRLPFPGFVAATLATINFDTLQEAERVRKQAAQGAVPLSETRFLQPGPLPQIEI